MCFYKLNLTEGDIKFNKIMRAAVFIAAAIIMQAAPIVKWGVTDKDNTEEAIAALMANEAGSTLEFANCVADFANDNNEKTLEKIQARLQEKVKAVLAKRALKGLEIKKLDDETIKVITDLPLEGRIDLETPQHIEDPTNQSASFETIDQKEENNLNKMMRRILGGKDLLTVDIKQKKTPGKDNKEDIKPEDQKDSPKVKKGDSFTWTIACMLSNRASNASFSNTCRGKEFSFYYLSSKGGHVKAYEHSASLSFEANKKFHMLWPFEKAVTPIMTNDTPCSFTFTSAPVLAALAGIVYALLF